MFSLDTPMANDCIHHIYIHDIYILTSAYKHVFCFWFWGHGVLLNGKIWDQMIDQYTVSPCFPAKRGAWTRLIRDGCLDRAQNKGALVGQACGHDMFVDFGVGAGVNVWSLHSYWFVGVQYIFGPSITKKGTKMNPAKLLPILLWLSQIALPDPECSNDFALSLHKSVFPWGLQDTEIQT